jgi:hypothetical protein
VIGVLFWPSRTPRLRCVVRGSRVRAVPWRSRRSAGGKRTHNRIRDTRYLVPTATVRTHAGVSRRRESDDREQRDSTPEQSDDDAPGRPREAWKLGGRFAPARRIGDDGGSYPVREARGVFERDLVLGWRVELEDVPLSAAHAPYLGRGRVSSPPKCKLGRSGPTTPRQIPNRGGARAESTSSQRGANRRAAGASAGVIDGLFRRRFHARGEAAGQRSSTRKQEPWRAKQKSGTDGWVCPFVVHGERLAHRNVTLAPRAERERPQRSSRSSAGR